MSFDLSESNPQQPNDKTLILQRRLRKHADRIAKLVPKHVTGRTGRELLYGRRQITALVRARRRKASETQETKKAQTTGGGQGESTVTTRVAQERTVAQERRKKDELRQKEKPQAKALVPLQAAAQYYVKGPGNVKFFHVKDADIATIENIATTTPSGGPKTMVATKRSGSLTKTSDDQHCTIAATYGRVSLELPRVRDECRQGWCVKGGNPNPNGKFECIPTSSKCTGMKTSKERTERMSGDAKRNERKPTDTSCACVMEKNGLAKHWWNLEKQYQKDPTVTDLFHKIHIKFLKISVCKYVALEKATRRAVKKMITGCVQGAKLPLLGGGGRRRKAINWAAAEGGSYARCNTRHQELAVGLI